jgi:hypothetical protein
MSNTTIAGIFDSAPLASEAVTSLLSLGLAKDDISIVMSDKAKERFTSAARDSGDRTAQDTALGAGMGGAMGALLAGLTTVGAVLIPGAQLMVVGPLVGLLAGLGTGAAVGGLAGVLTGAGISATESAKYSDELKAGKAVIIAHCKDDAQALACRAILMAEGADQIKAA